MTTRARNGRGNARTGTAATNKPANKACCYCNGSRDLQKMELYCNKCNNWFHGTCLKDLTKFAGLKFMVCYVFNCKDCSPSKMETWTPKNANFGHMLLTALANMTYEERQKTSGPTDKPVMFSLKKVIVPYFEENWESLTSMKRREKPTWHQALKRAMLREPEVFVSQADENDDSDEADGLFGLNETDLAKIGPCHEFIKILNKRPTATQNTAAQEPVVTVDDGPKTRGAKRKAERQESTTSSSSKRNKASSDYTSTKVNGSGLVVEHPYTKDGYRYYLTEPDVHAPFRKEWEELDEAKAVPGFMHRLVRPSDVELSTHDRAPQLRLDGRLCVTGEKGYSMIRCTHGVSHGSWYYECTVLDQPESSHARIGWAQELGCLQAPCGYDHFSYAWRSRMGTKFHQSVGKHYSETGYGSGDVLGFLIHLPLASEAATAASEQILPNTHKDRHLIKFKNFNYFEQRDEPQQVVKELKPLAGSQIYFYKNGECQGVAFEDVYQGTYFPAISLYRNMTVRVNFGPNFAHLPRQHPSKPGEPIRALCERADELHVEQCLADMLYLSTHTQHMKQLVGIQP